MSNRMNTRGSKLNACSDTDLGEVLFHYVMFCDKENRDLSSKIYPRFLKWHLLRFAGPLNMFVPFLMPVDEKNSFDQI